MNIFPNFLLGKKLMETWVIGYIVPVYRITCGDDSCTNVPHPTIHSLAHLSSALVSVIWQALRDPAIVQGL